jgi:hypothetical protein
MNKLVLILLLASMSHAQEWVRTEYHDELHNESGAKFFLAAKEKGGGIEVVCSKGKLKVAWLLTDKGADVQVKTNFVGDISTEVDVEYRRDAEPKPHHLSLPVSKDFHGILLQRSHGFADVSEKGTFSGFENLMYGPFGFGGGEYRRNKKANNWARKLIVGVSAYADSDSVFTFDVPDPTVVNSECGIK